MDASAVGSLYALIALGYTMVYGIVKLINFAHGDVFMVGSFTSYFAVTRFTLHQWPQIPHNLHGFLGRRVALLRGQIRPRLRIGHGGMCLDHARAPRRSGPTRPTPSARPMRQNSR